MVEGDMAGRRACAGRDARLGVYPVASVTIYTAVLERLGLLHDHTLDLDRPGTNKIKLQNASMG